MKGRIEIMGLSVECARCERLRERFFYWQEGYVDLRVFFEDILRRDGWRLGWHNEGPAWVCADCPEDDRT